MKQVQVYAHRGASAYAPENTLPAFALAMEQGADGIELDIHLTKDGELVVIHDEKVDRTTNGTGLVKDYTLAELRGLCADNGMEGFSEARIPTLREVLALVKPSDMMVNIEIKTGILWYDGIEEKALRLVQDMGMQDRVIWSSFNHYSTRSRVAGPRSRDRLSLRRHYLRCGKVRRRPRGAGTASGTVQRENGRVFCSGILPAGWPCGSGR